jgi:hypothetical protein
MGFAEISNLKKSLNSLAQALEVAFPRKEDEDGKPIDDGLITEQTVPTEPEESTSRRSSEPDALGRSDSHVLEILQEMRTKLIEISKSSKKNDEFIDRFQPIKSGLPKTGDDSPFRAIGNSTLNAVQECIDTLHTIRNRNYLFHHRDRRKHLGDQSVKIDQEAIDEANAEVHKGRCLKDARRMQLKYDLPNGSLDDWEQDRFEELYGLTFEEVLQHAHDADLITVSNIRATAIMELAKLGREPITLKADVERYQDHIRAGSTDTTRNDLDRLYLRIKSAFRRLLPDEKLPVETGADLSPYVIERPLSQRAEKREKIASRKSKVAASQRSGNKSPSRKFASAEVFDRAASSIGKLIPPWSLKGKKAAEAVDTD